MLRKKHPPLEGVLAQVVLHIVFNERFQPHQRIGAVTDSLEDDRFPDPDRLVISGVPDFLFAGEVPVKSAFGQSGGSKDIADRGVIVPFHRKQMKGFFYDVFPGIQPFLTHDIPIVAQFNFIPTGLFLNHRGRRCQPFFPLPASACHLAIRFSLSFLAPIDCSR